MHRVWLSVAAPLILISCMTEHAPAGQEVFDEETGNTVTVVSKPLVFARERTDVAAHARDYATLVAVEVDRSGSFKDFLLLYRWSTVDKRMTSPPQPDEEEMRLTSDGRVISLKPLESLPVGVGSKVNLHLPRHGAAIVRAFAVDLNLLRFLAASNGLTLQMPREPLDAPFQIWEDGRRALGEFVHQTSAP
jgi:hypothetical protein